MALDKIRTYIILDRPLIFWLAILLFLAMAITIAIPLLNKRLKKRIPLKWHIRSAWVSVALALMHGVLGAAKYY